ncbi:peptidoglycan DD-metalloendopeptidase family protein [Aquimarina sp. ERC-38]|uniref:peptidoglycan DD-metalloendopeptidase family protein n=1 Tax=Aquimarina sp. ERC-38 TaxID=2949996 RepID=UPI0022473C9D|nr:peptidoglycan DD-metalloendopeptidase family protein [Aquimarina sp. ERC-38]UZO79541.1 peptidoglycan DD-metalloendopeptidase family protein [Aquimarina sp. ERC-38]
MRILFFLCLFFGFLGYSQTKNKNDYFNSPVKFPLELSGTFGELRSNHFHSGLDIKTKGQEGAEVFVAAPGVISRIKISHFGYGKALYVKHGNGQTSVYAHLKEFAPKIEAYVKKRQYAKEFFEIELYPKDSILTLEKDELLAYSGNTGGSGGPHLHFEIRDAYSRPLNPLKYDLEVKDTVAPVIQNLFLYQAKGQDMALSQTPMQLNITQTDMHTYQALPVATNGKIGFGIQAFDRQNGSSNQNGVYSYQLIVNGQSVFTMEMNRFSFSETRYINQLTDYSYYQTNNDRIARLFILKNNPLSIYDKTVNHGFLEVQKEMSYNVEIILKDFQQNTTTIQIPLTYSTQQQDNNKDITNAKGITVDANDLFTFNKGIFDVYIPKKVLYEDATITIDTEGSTLYLHKDVIPLHKKITIAADVSNYKPEDRSKLYFGELTENGKVYYSTTSLKGTRLSTKTRNFGTYGIYTDSIPPVITPVNFDKDRWISYETELKLKIDDMETGIQSYKATLNGKFILTEYDYKTGMLIYKFKDAIIDTAQNNLEVIVLDKVGNRTVLNTTFYRKP